MASIWPVASGFDIGPLCEQLDAHPEIWNQHRERTEQYGTPHDGVSDIWVRYNAWANYTGDWAAFNGPHVSEWYPEIRHIPAAWSLSRRVQRLVGASELGGVLITRIPPSGEVKPHVDGGWHAAHYRKFAVQVRSAPGQAFCFDDAQLAASPGEVYGFDNSRRHWVVNPTEHERMTLIVCVR